MPIRRGRVGIAKQGGDFGGEVNMTLEVEVLSIGVEILHEVWQGGVIRCREGIPGVKRGPAPE